MNVDYYHRNISLYSHCGVHLLYMGNNLFGKLIRKPERSFGEIMISFPLSVRRQDTQDNSNLSLLSMIADDQSYLPDIDSSSGNNQYSDVSGQPDTVFDSPTPSISNADSNLVNSGSNNKTTLPMLQPETRPNEQIVPTVPEEEEGIVPASNHISNDSTPADISNGTRNLVHVPVTEVINNTCFVRLSRLDNMTINMFTMKLPSVMKERDKTVTEAEPVSADQNDPIDTSTNYNMRSRPPHKRFSTKPLCEMGMVKYTESSSDTDGTDWRHSKRHTKAHRPGRAPSTARIRAQSVRTNKPAIRPIAAKVNNTATDDEISVHDPSESSESEPLSNLIKRANKQDPAKSVTDVTGDRKTAFFKTTTHGVHKFKKLRSFKCKYCDATRCTVKELNVHYRNKHIAKKCSQCGNSFYNPDSLKRHMLMHTVNKYSCHTCDRTFAFASKRDEHRITHRCHGMQKCNRGNCDKVFKHVSDLQKHILTHDNKPLKCNKCDYANPDPRNLRQHSLKHEMVGHYECPKCHKRFKFHIQKHRHLKNNACSGSKRSR